MRAKRLLVLCAVLVLAVSSLPVLSGCESVDVELLDQNLFIYTTEEDFDTGENDGTIIADYGNGAVMLEEGAEEGIYTSEVVGSSPFVNMILSWNAETPGDSHVSFEARVRVNGDWSNWHSWGTWANTVYTDEDGRTRLPGSSPPSSENDPLASLPIGELYVEGGEAADAFQYRLIFGSGSDSSNQPKVRLLAATIRHTSSDQFIYSATPENASELAALDIDHDVPTYSQYQRDSAIASAICSPTSVAMAMSHFGYDVTPEEISWAARDYQSNLFGNWSFSLASATQYDLSGYVSYFYHEDDPWLGVKELINDGALIVVSVRYQSPDHTPGGASYPVVNGVPISSTGGHLVMIRGFTVEDGVEYVIVNDSAGEDNDEVYRKYRADQFARAWMNKVTYVIYEDPDEIGQPHESFRTEAELTPVGDPEDGTQYFELVVDGEPISVDRDQMRSGTIAYNGEKSTPLGLTHFDRHVGFDVDSPAGTYVFTFNGMEKETYVATLEWE